MKRRSFLKHGLAVGAAAAIPLRSVLAATMPDGYVSVKAYGAKGDGVSDDSVAVQNAMNANLNIWFPAGVYLVGNLKLKDSQRLLGEGASSTLLQKLGAPWCVSANPGTLGSADPAKNLKYISIRNLRFEGQSGNVPFDEKYHLLNLNGVTDAEVVACWFVKYVADGIYLGSSNAGGVERHNIRVTIRDCYFDGVTKNNRNGISIIDGTDIIVDSCKFTRSGRPDMPAAIDIEPNGGINDTFTRISRITISRCTIWDMNSSGLIAVILRPNDLMSYPAKTITISNCKCYGNGLSTQTGLLVTQSSQGSQVNPTSNTPPLDLVVTGCTFDGAFRPFNIWAAKGVRIDSTIFCNSSAYGTLGDYGGVYRNMNILFKNSVFKYVGSDKTYGLTSMRICGVDYLGFDGCTFEDCGPLDGVNGQGLVFGGITTSSNIALTNNRIVSLLGRTRYGITVTSGHKMYAASNQQVGTELINVTGNDFVPKMY
jgi:hypothetical protein